MRYAKYDPISGRILEIINEEPDINKANKKLLDMAKTRGGLDNITLIIMKL